LDALFAYLLFSFFESLFPTYTFHKSNNYTFFLPRKWGKVKVEKLNNDEVREEERQQQAPRG